MQKHVNLVDLVKSFPTNIFLQNLASIQQRTSLIKFDHLTEKSEKGSISNLSTKCVTAGVAVGVAADSAAVSGSGVGGAAFSRADLGVRKQLQILPFRVCCLSDFAVSRIAGVRDTG